MLSDTPQAAPRNGVAETAYFLWLQDGMRHGHDVRHWLQAEREEIRTAVPAEPARTRRRSRKPRDAKTAERGTRVYKLKFLAPDGTVRLIMAVPAATDADALIEAGHVHDGRSLEVWRGDEKVGVLPDAEDRKAG